MDGGRQDQELEVCEEVILGTNRMNTLSLIFRVSILNYLLVVIGAFLYGIYQNALSALFYAIVFTFPFLFAHAALASLVYLFIKRRFTMTSNFSSVLLTVVLFVIISLVGILLAAVVAMWAWGYRFDTIKLLKSFGEFLWLVPLAFTSGVLFPIIDRIKKRYSLLSKLRSLLKY